MSNFYGKGLKGKATKLHSEYIRSLGYCEHCHRSDTRLECAHIYSRAISSVRCDPDNAVCLCFQCHRMFTQSPIDFTRWLEAYLGHPHLEHLLMKKNELVKANEAYWLYWVDHLKSLPQPREPAA